MVVDGDVDAVFLAQLVERVEGVLVGLRDERLDAHFLGKIERLAALVGILVKGGITPKLSSLTSESASFFLTAARTSAGESSLNFTFGWSLLTTWTGAGLDVVQPQRGGLVDGLEKGEPIELHA